MLVRGFDPIVGNDALAVILGTLPSEESVRAAQYYANPNNAFWYIAAQLFGATGTYTARVQALIRNQIAIWDVLKSAERSGSQDQQIIKGTAVPNDFQWFFCTYPSIKTVFFNGQAAEGFFQNLVTLRLPAGVLTPRYRLLPSTSPANTHATKETKTLSWRRALTGARDE